MFHSMNYVTLAALTLVYERYRVEYSTRYANHSTTIHVYATRSAAWW
jgi:hypothetical protein